MREFGFSCRPRYQVSSTNLLTRQHKSKLRKPKWSESELLQETSQVIWTKKFTLAKHSVDTRLFAACSLSSAQLLAFSALSAESMRTKWKIINKHLRRRFFDADSLGCSFRRLREDIEKVSRKYREGIEKSSRRFRADNFRSKFDSN